MVDIGDNDDDLLSGEVTSPDVDRRRALLPLPNLSDDELGDATALLDLLTPVVFDAGQQVFAEGDPGNHVYVIRSGIVKVTCRGARARENLIALAGPGDIVGELSVFDPGPRSSSVIAVSGVHAGILDRNTLRRWVTERPAAAEVLLQLLARQVKRRHDQIADLASADAACGVARQILYLASRFGVTVGDGAVVLPVLTDDEFADLVATTADSVHQVLRDFQSRSWIRIENSTVLVTDRGALESRALGL
jgi:CRP/FNR family transcriptional regulator, cyclic AMP receptor protein